MINNTHKTHIHTHIYARTPAHKLTGAHTQAHTYDQIYTHTFHEFTSDGQLIRLRRISRIVRNVTLIFSSYCGCLHFRFCVHVTVFVFV